MQNWNNEGRKYRQKGEVCLNMQGVTHQRGDHTRWEVKQLETSKCEQQNKTERENEWDT